MSIRVPFGFRIPVVLLTEFQDLAFHASFAILLKKTKQLIEAGYPLQAIISDYKDQGAKPSVYEVESGYKLLLSTPYFYGWNYGLAPRGVELAQFVQEYGYDNASDKPEELSPQDWQERGHRWRKAIPEIEASRLLDFRTISFQVNRFTSLTMLEQAINKGE